jgi:hypothetical protein
MNLVDLFDKVDLPGPEDTIKRKGGHWNIIQYLIYSRYGFDATQHLTTA